MVAEQSSNTNHVTAEAAGPWRFTPTTLTALDARTGRPTTLGPDGTAYIGVLGGLVSITARQSSR